MVTGSPLRTELLGERISKEAAKEIMGFDKAQPLVLILGGSQGAQRINEFIARESCRSLSDRRRFCTRPVPAILTRCKNFRQRWRLRTRRSRSAMCRSDILAARRNSGNDMATALTAADVVVARSGSSVCEFAAFGLPAILIPIAESANDHQRVDAYEFAKAGAGDRHRRGEPLPGIFFAQLKNILTDADLRAKMSAASSAFFIPGAAEKIADELMRMGG